MKTKLLQIMALFKIKKKRQNTVIYQPHSATLAYMYLDKLLKIVLAKLVNTHTMSDIPVQKDTLG